MYSYIIGNSHCDGSGAGLYINCNHLYDQTGLLHYTHKYIHIDRVTLIMNYHIAQ